MIAKEIINNAIIPLKTSDKASFALELMDEYKVSHLPIVNNIEFLGLISNSDIVNQEMIDEPIGNHSLSMAELISHCNEDQHMFEIVKLVSSLKLSLIPVLDIKNNYLGSITLDKLVDAFSSICSIETPGGVIVLEISNRDYLLTQIAQIVESNNAKILSLFISSNPDSTKLEVTIKINKIDIENVLQTFTRYNYSIKSSFSEVESFDNLKDRYDSLMRYLNV
ncbi:MAG: CBS domain-containing protein [Bacteroidales bacterium]|nr:CBS domain-containing protein [Bacteroidales bacterium]